MSKKQKKVLWPLVAIVALGLSAYAFSSAHRLTARRPPESKSGNQNPIAVATSKGDEYVRRGRLWPQLRWNLRAFGDRLEKPGKERLALAGTLQRPGDLQPVPVLLVVEFPDHLRLDIQEGGPHHVITFNGERASKGGGALDKGEEDLIETLVYDTAEHFFGGQSRGTATRLLGEHFRLDGDTQANYTGPFYDVYQTTEQIKHTVPARQQTKLYCFNSDTRLLERINYELERNGSRTSVEIRINDWQKVHDQQVPLRIIRLENNQPALTLTFNSAVLTAKVDDGAFGK